VSGNVSLYNDTNGVSIFPTPTIGMVGLLEDIEKHVTSWFKSAGDSVYVIGDLSGTLGASEYLSWIHGKTAGAPPALDLDSEKAIQDFLLRCIDVGLIRSAHDISDGGLAVALAESCLTDPKKSVGVEVSLADSNHARSRAELLFGEGASRILVSVSPEQSGTFEQLAAAAALATSRIGKVIQGSFKIVPWMDLPMDRLRRVWEDGFEKVLNKA